jgi:hypothetical protein
MHAECRDMNVALLGSCCSRLYHRPGVTAGEAVCPGAVGSLERSGGGFHGREQRRSCTWQSETDLGTGHDGDDRAQHC